ncbi:hypothetical protein Indivirus_6_10 [Indivirus ILV1]|uniref:Uncharacterized protein n=1 Tax=Indivirus ILV1 TaxID=1977633 RepID=A0A1V0SEA2_9VIRU|nr:hypothetical protein Indivirus_6_10 [Indivirus ILV1]
MSWIRVILTTQSAQSQSKKRKVENDDNIFTLYVDQNEEIMDKINDLIGEEKGVNIKSIRLISSCIGCREDQPNQLAHMEPGGCLYNDE